MCFAPDASGVINRLYVFNTGKLIRRKFGGHLHRGAGLVEGWGGGGQSDVFPEGLDEHTHTCGCGLTKRPVLLNISLPTSSS